MALNESTLAKLMQVTFGIFNPGSKNEFECYAEGVVMGLKLGTATIITTGVSGSPGSGSFVGAIQGGPLVMAPLVAINSVGVMPPIPEGMVTPLQLLWYLAISQISLHALIALQVEAPPTDAVSTGVGLITPGGFSVNAQVISKFIILAYLKKGLTITPRRRQVADIIGKSTQQMMSLAIMTIPIAGGVPSVPPVPAVGTRVGVIS